MRARITIAQKNKVFDYIMTYDGNFMDFVDAWWDSYYRAKTFLHIQTTPGVNYSVKTSEVVEVRIQEV